MILMIDHEDSFTYNLVHYLEETGQDVKVIHHQDITDINIEKLNPQAVILSPGPGHPSEQKDSINLVHALKETVPLLGVCLGFQIIVEAFGGSVIEASRPMHGRIDQITHDRKYIYNTLDAPLQVTRYHSLIADEQSFPEELMVTGRSSSGEIMSCRHKHYQIEGVQYHPEAILTKHGKQLLQNFLDLEHGVKVNHV
ncbi:aminodeoxychorismate/anthranilate synthase component II [Filobacillus milosensis]|uniref:Aminodeoxychorismate/anthranilate synthase component II n=1 Tax=Filobacillus milosensis TaxID=94137 RepID=A0A4Y8ISZ2_9BACI|nr:aminodeoxychorismate/anthranilate synthase component II [Filobacillus milosensis]TFB25020.1 aminodeoxychorismate/anthranilate synthase component II [Filobacillus milosensis]